MTWLGALNAILLQWLFVRLTRVKDTATGAKHWALMGFIFPMSGWLGSYWFIGRWIWPK